MAHKDLLCLYRAVLLQLCLCLALGFWGLLHGFKNLEKCGRSLFNTKYPCAHLHFLGTSASRGVPEVALLKSSFPVAGAQISSKNHYLPGQIVRGAAAPSQARRGREATARACDGAAQPRQTPTHTSTWHKQRPGPGKPAPNGLLSAPASPRSTSLGPTSYSAPKQQVKEETCGLEEASYRPHEADCGPQGPSTASRRPNNLASSRPCARSQNGKPDAPVRFNRRPLTHDQNKTRSYSGPK